MAKKVRKKPAVEPAKRRGKPQKYDSGIVRPKSIGAPDGLWERLDTAAEQTGLSRSEIVCAGLERILDQSPDRLRREVRP